MEEIWITSGKNRFRGVILTCKVCGGQIKCRKCLEKNHSRICAKCSSSILGEKWKGNLINRKGKVDPYAISKHPDYERKRALTSRTRRKIEIVLEKGNQCSICKKTYPIACYAFHHRVKEEKLFTLAKWIRRNIPKEEIEKCDLVCLNCHSILHYGSTMA